MAKKQQTDRKKTPSFFEWIFRNIRRICKLFFCIFLVLLGGVIFNLDRVEILKIHLLKYQDLLSAPIARMLPGATATQSAGIPEEELQGMIINVHDGDTVTLLDEKQNLKYKIRLFGIDAPEKKQTHGTTSTQALQEKILGKNVKVLVISTDIYQRSIGKIMLDSRYINLEMVSEGHAWHYSEYAKKEFDLAAGEKEARLQKLGLWQDANPQPPWEFRDKK